MSLMIIEHAGNKINVHLFVCLSVCLFVCLSVCLSIRLSVCQSVSGRVSSDDNYRVCSCETRLQCEHITVWTHYSVNTFGFQNAIVATLSHFLWNILIWKKVEEYLRLFETYGGNRFSLFLMSGLRKLISFWGRMVPSMKLIAQKELIILFQMAPSRILCDQ